jgi:hypothetical protein
MNSAYRSRREHIEKKTKQSKKLARKTKLLRKKPAMRKVQRMVQK